MKRFVLILAVIAVCGAYPPAGILGFPEFRSQRTRSGVGGLKGMLDEIAALIPFDQLKELLDQKLATDHYVQLAFIKLNSDEFGSIVQTLQTNPAYNRMKDRLRDMGVLDEINGIFRPWQ